jgi:membrane protease YdiL (CAAX protease family)
MTRAVAGRRDSGCESVPAGRCATGVTGYFRASEMPLASLLFVIPMIVVYEVGTRWYATDPVQGTEQRIVAFNLLRQFLEACGAHLRYLPCFTIVSLLLGVHLFRRDPWVVKPGTLVGMGAESIGLAFPLLLAGQLVMQYLQHLTLAGLSGESRQMVIISFGAGVYEEAIFRLGGFALLSLWFRDTMRLEKRQSVLLIVLCSSLLFSLYHYLGYEQFQLQTFLFRTLAGIYFAIVYLFRGFGVTAGTHAVYDIVVSSLH